LCPGADGNEAEVVEVPASGHRIPAERLAVVVRHLLLRFFA